jgi:ABC-2 type transport system permease protein
MSNSTPLGRLPWLVRRELWENRAIWVVPAAFAGAIIVLLLTQVLFGHHVSLDPMTSEDSMHEWGTGKLEAMLSLALVAITAAFFAVQSFVQFMYATDTLYGERRDRSILFWKSLPVSDVETVLAKFLVATVLVLVPALVAAFITQLAIALAATVDLRAFPQLLVHLWSPAAWASAGVTVLYGAVAVTLWYLPYVAWLLFVSARAPRAPTIWAFLPLGVGLVEVVVLRSTHVFRFIAHRFAFVPVAFDIPHKGTPLPDPVPLVHNVIAPAKFFANPELWLGLVVAALLVWATVWSRRQGETAG